MKKVTKIRTERRLNPYSVFLFDTNVYSFKQIYKTLQRSSTSAMRDARYIHHFDLIIKKNIYSETKIKKIPIKIKKYKNLHFYDYYIFFYLPEYAIFSCIVVYSENIKTNERFYY